MKKIFGIGFVILTISLLLTGCGENKTLEENLNLTLSEIVDKVYEGISEDEMPMVGNVEVTKENMSYYLGIDDLDIKEGLASEPLMSSIAHSVVVVKVNDGVDIEQAKKNIKEKANPRKWVCVEAEQVIVESKGDIIILIMSDNELSTKIQTNFKNLK